MKKLAGGFLVFMGLACFFSVHRQPALSLIMGVLFIYAGYRLIRPGKISENATTKERAFKVIGWILTFIGIVGFAVEIDKLIEGKPDSPIGGFIISTILGTSGYNLIRSAGRNKKGSSSDIPIELQELAFPSAPVPQNESENSRFESNTEHEGRIDLNSADIDGLLGLPGIELPAAERLAEERAKRRGFETIEEVGHLLELQPHQVEKLRLCAILGPYEGSGLYCSAGKRMIDL